MKPHDARALRELVAAARAFVASGAYDLLTLDEMFAVRFADDPEPWYGGVVDGSDDDVDVGIYLARGATGLSHLRLGADDRASDLARKVAQLGVLLVRWEDASERTRALLPRAGLSFRRGDIVPDVMVRDRNKGPRDAEAKDARRLIAVMRGVEDAVASGAIDVRRVRAGAEMPTFVVPDVRAAAATDDLVAIEMRVHADAEGRTEQPVRRSQASEGWDVRDGRWAVALVEGLAARPDDDPAGPALSIVACDAEGGGPVTVRVLPRRDVVLAARELARGNWTAVGSVGIDAEDEDGDEVDASDLDACDDEGCDHHHGHYEDDEEDDGGPVRWWPTTLAFEDAALRDLVAPAFEGTDVECVVAPRSQAMETLLAGVRKLRDDLVASAATMAEGGLVPDDPGGTGADVVEDDEEAGAGDAADDDLGGLTDDEIDAIVAELDEEVFEDDDEEWGDEDEGDDAPADA